LKSSSRAFVVAAAQMRSTADRERNLAVADRLAAAAARRGARLIAFPENVALLVPETGRPRGETLEGPTFGHFAAMARRHAAWVLAGTIAERAPRGKVFNTSVLYDPRGHAAAVYRKIHLFDVDIPGKATHRESARVAPGRKTVVADTPLASIGMSICYDLRFPELYRRLVAAGAQVLVVPSAFTAYTGRAHWTALLRARAIENLAWVVAPAQAGSHHPGRRTYGHACIVDPWGRVVAEKRSGTGIVTWTIDLSRQERMRRELPALSHARPELLGASRRSHAGRAIAAILPGLSTRRASLDDLSRLS
jgi:predicted amidohydrolase